MADRKINVGVIGYGMSAKVFHIPLILTTPGYVLHSIVQRKAAPDNDASKDHPDARIFDSTDALLNDPAVDLVVITTPPNTHFELATCILKAHKHALVEKPFVPTSAQATTLAATARSVNKLLCIYQNRRWDSDFLTFQHLQRTGKLGRIVEFETHFDRHKPMQPTNWKGQLGMADAGGVIYDLGTHLIDQVVCAFGMPAAVSAVFQVSRQDGAEEPDAVTVLMSYADGLLATVKAGVISIESRQLRYWVRGTEGSYKKYGLDVQEDQLKLGKKPGDVGFGVETAGAAGELTILVDGKPITRAQMNVGPETYGKLYERFAEAIRKDDEKLVPVKASEARDVLRVIEAAKESVETGRTVKF